MKSQNRKLSFPIVEADPLHHSGFLSESECGNEMREGGLRTRTRVITDKTFHSLIVCLCYDNKIGFKTSPQCQKSVGFNVKVVDIFGLLPACQAATEGTWPDCGAGCRISSQTSSKISAPLSWKSLLRSDEEKFKMF